MKSISILAFLFICALVGAKAQPIFVFENGLRFSSIEEEVATLKQLGYDGMGSAKLPNLAKRLPVYQKSGLRIFSIYVALKAQGETASYDPAILEAIQLLQGSNAIVELNIQGRSTVGDTAVVEKVREIGAAAEAAGLRVALYPHANFYVEKVGEAVRVAKAVDLENVGIMFNLCHFLRNEKLSDLDTVLAAAAPHLFQVSTCGADTDGTDWTTLIQPLDKGSFDQSILFDLLRKQGFDGPVGLQCYNIRGNSKEFLNSSIEAWKAMQAN